MDGYLSKPMRPELAGDEVRRASEKAGPEVSREQADSGKPSPAEWDLAELLERLDGDQDFLRELLVIFRQDIRTNLGWSQAAFEQQDFAALSRAAHTIKGMLKNLSMGAAAETAAALEKAARESFPGKSEELLRRLTKELQGILPEVEAQLAEVKS